MMGFRGVVLMDPTEVFVVVTTYGLSLPRLRFFEGGSNASSMSSPNTEPGVEELLPLSSSSSDTVEVLFKSTAPSVNVALLIELTRLRVCRRGRPLADRVCTALAVSLESFEVRMVAHENLGLHLKLVAFGEAGPLTPS